MSSPGPSETVPRPSKNKTKDKTKKKSKPQPVIVTNNGKNEGQNPHWAYEPPSGSVLFDTSFEGETFDWDSIKKDDDVEIWLMRVPDSVKPKNLDGVEIDAPSPSRGGQVGSFTRKGTVYDIWSMGNDDKEFAEELKGLSCLFPRKKKSGKLYMAPKEIARHLVVSAQPSKPVPPENPSILNQNPSRPSYPRELLKHHFVPYGARAESLKIPDPANIDVDGGPVEDGTLGTEAEGSPHKTKESKVKEPKSRKRKVEKETVLKTVKKPKLADFTTLLRSEVRAKD